MITDYTTNTDQGATAREAATVVMSRKEFDVYLHILSDRPTGDAYKYADITMCPAEDSELGKQFYMIEAFSDLAIGQAIAMHHIDLNTVTVVHTAPLPGTHRLAEEYLKKIRERRAQ